MFFQQSNDSLYTKENLRTHAKKANQAPQLEFNQLYLTLYFDQVLQRYAKINNPIPERDKKKYQRTYNKVLYNYKRYSTAKFWDCAVEAAYRGTEIDLLYLRLFLIRFQVKLPVYQKQVLMQQATNKKHQRVCALLIQHGFKFSDIEHALFSGYFMDTETCSRLGGVSVAGTTAQKQADTLYQLANPVQKLPNHKCLFRP